MRDLLLAGHTINSFGNPAPLGASEVSHLCLAADGAIITKAWTSEQRFSHHGRFWTFKEILVEPPPSQKPHPPFWMAAGNPSSIRRVAVRGYNLLLDQFAAFDVIGERIALFKSECAARGRALNPMHIALARDMYVANNQAAKDAALERNRQFHERILSVARWPDRSGGSHILAYHHAPEEAETNSLVGTPDEIMGKLEALRRRPVIVSTPIVAAFGYSRPCPSSGQRRCATQPYWSMFHDTTRFGCCRSDIDSVHVRHVRLGGDSLARGNASSHSLEPGWRPNGFVTVPVAASIGPALALVASAVCALLMWLATIVPDCTVDVSNIFAGFVAFVWIALVVVFAGAHAYIMYGAIFGMAHGT